MLISPLSMRIPTSILLAVIGVSLSGAPTALAYLTPEEVAEMMKVKVITIYRMCRAGKIPAVKFGRMWRINSMLMSQLLQGRGIK